jgi:hypothetical protein
MKLIETQIERKRACGGLALQIVPTHIPIRHMLFSFLFEFQWVSYTLRSAGKFESKCKARAIEQIKPHLFIFHLLSRTDMFQNWDDACLGVFLMSKLPAVSTLPGAPWRCSAPDLHVKVRARDCLGEFLESELPVVQRVLQIARTKRFSRRTLSELTKFRSKRCSAPSSPFRAVRVWRVLQ